MYSHIFLSWSKTTSEVAELEGIGCSVTVTERPIERSLPSVEYDKTLFPDAIPQGTNKIRRWMPQTLQPYFLLLLIIMSGGIIAILQIFLIRSQRDGGIIIAPDTNQLPAGMAFCILYLPTIIALCFSFTWTWVDLDVKRLQPYWQMSRKGGAQGKDSLLLQYPFDFAPFVPYRAFRSRHWPVFSASFAAVIFPWFLIPLQSSIFASTTVHRTEVVNMSIVTANIYWSKQSSLLTASYAQSAFNIAWLNETLPPFMTRDFMLLPFTRAEEYTTLHENETWTGGTRLYSVDINCQDATKANNGSYLSDNGCAFDGYDPPIDIGDDQYTSTYVGFWYKETVNESLISSCPMSANGTFFLQWGRSKQWIDHVTKPLAATTLYCQSIYWEQDVEATVSPPSMAVTNIVPTGPRQSLPDDLFNITEFESSLSAGSGAFANRGDYPLRGWPDVTERTAYLDLAQTYDYLPPVTGFAVAAYQRPAADYMDAHLLEASYQAAYRLLFARRLVDIINSTPKYKTEGDGRRDYEIQAIQLVPAFVYAVEALIGATILATCFLVVLSYSVENSLRSDTATIASTMSLMAENQPLVNAMGRYDCASNEDINEAFKDSTFGLLEESAPNSTRGYGMKLFGHPSGARSVLKTVLSHKSMLPEELRWSSGVAFLTTQVCILVLLLYTYAYARNNSGLPLSSSSILVNQLVENYLPMAIAAFYEPAWLVLNRLICMLEPYQQLRRGRSRPSQSLTIDYHSVPPQAVILGALKAGHLSLAMICAMTLLANILSVAFGGLMYEGNMHISKAASFDCPYQLPINGTSLGNETFAISRPYYDQYYVAMSNITAGTPLPPWTDNERFYLPFQTSQTLNVTDITLRARTTAIGTSLNCVPLTLSGTNSIEWQFTGYSIHMNVTLAQDDGSNCTLHGNSTVTGDMSGTNSTAGYAFEIVVPAVTGSSAACRASIIAGWVRATESTRRWYETWTDTELDQEVSERNPADGSWLACSPIFDLTLHEVTVDTSGHVQTSTALDNTTYRVDQSFEPDVEKFTLSYHKALSLGGRQTLPHWHTDSYPTDLVNYLLVQAKNSSAFLDPFIDPPTFEDAASQLSSFYTRIFAITLGINAENVLTLSDNTTVDGHIIAPETRILLSAPMFAMSTAILVAYILATLTVYVRRPWKILPRMPTSIASQMAYLAGSEALEELHDTAAMSLRGRNILIQSSERRYGFGRFLGTDGRDHFGVEREPFVQLLKQEELGSQHEENGRWRRRLFRSFG